MDFLSEISNIRTHFVINILLYGEFRTLLHIHKMSHFIIAGAAAAAAHTITRDLFCNFNFTILVFVLCASMHAGCRAIVPEMRTRGEF